MSQADDLKQKFLDRLQARELCVGVIGLGYVGLPLAVTAVERGLRVLGFDVDPEKPAQIAAGKSYLKSFADSRVAAALDSGRLAASTDFSRLAECDAILICVPTPLDRHHEPDLSYVVKTTQSISEHLRAGQLVVLESTTYPGTTSEVLAPILSSGGLVCEEDYFLGFSPEREDPGNASYGTANIPKIVAGEGPVSGELVAALYRAIVDEVVPVSSTATAEAVKLMENVFRSVNIALVNELKLIYGKMGIDIWEVIEAAKTKPFGFMPFYPGPGLGGHCIPIDPFYLTWKAKEYGIRTRFIELAGEINTNAPAHVMAKLIDALNQKKGKALSATKVLVMGVAYKKNIDDMRESPALVLLEMLRAGGAAVDYYDPFVAEIPPTREHADLTGLRSLAWEQVGQGHDLALICTDHDGVDYGDLAARIDLIVDTRNTMAGVAVGGAVVIAA